jgi:hypothetical protein
MKNILHTQMNALAEAMMADVQTSYDEGDSVAFFNALKRLESGTQGLKNLAETASILDDLQLRDEQE